MKLVLDEHLSPQVAHQLRQRGFDALTVAEAGLGGQPDGAVFRWAVEQERAVVTRDIRDHRALHAQAISRGERHHGLILVSRRHPNSSAGIGGLVPALAELLESLPSDVGPGSGEYWA